MSAGLKGLNKRVEPSESSDVYLTPQWAIDFLKRNHDVSGLCVIDPCAGDGRIGRTLGTNNLLFDISPLADDVCRASFQELDLSCVSGACVVTNPPYNLLDEFLEWCWSRETVVEVIVLVRFGYLCSSSELRSRWLWKYLQPKKRLAFETLDGKLPSTGVDHGWAIYRRGFEGEAKLVLRKV